MNDKPEKVSSTDGPFRLFGRWINKHRGLLGLIVGIGGVAIALFTLWWTHEVGLIAYNHSTVQIYDPKKALGSISILTKGGQKIEDKVFAIETIISNAGDLPANAIRLRRPLTISYGPDTRVIAQRVTVPKGGEDIKPKVSPGESAQDAQALLGTSIRIEWRHFDPGHSFKVVAIVASKSWIEPSIGGHFNKFSIVQAAKESPNPADKWIVSLGTALIGGVIIAGLSAIVVMYGLIRLFGFSEERASEFGGAIFVVMMVLAFAIIAINKLVLQTTVPEIKSGHFRSPPAQSLITQWRLLPMTAGQS